MSHTSDTAVVETVIQTSTRCRHIHANGSQCGSPALRSEIFCYYHHTTRRPKPGPGKMRYLDATEPFELPVIEDRASALSVASQVISRIATNDLDIARAGRIIYMLQVLTRFLPPESQPAEPADSASAAPGDPIPAPTLDLVPQIILDDRFGPIAPASPTGNSGCPIHAALSHEWVPDDLPSTCSGCNPIPITRALRC